MSYADLRSHFTNRLCRAKRTTTLHRNVGVPTTSCTRRGGITAQLSRDCGGGLSDTGGRRTLHIFQIRANRLGPTNGLISVTGPTRNAPRFMSVFRGRSKCIAGIGNESTTGQTAVPPRRHSPAAYVRIVQAKLCAILKGRTALIASAAKQDAVTLVMIMVVAVCENLLNPVVQMLLAFICLIRVGPFQYCRYRTCRPHDPKKKALAATRDKRLATEAIKIVLTVQKDLRPPAPVRCFSIVMMGSISVSVVSTLVMIFNLFVVMRSIVIL